MKGKNKYAIKMKTLEIEREEIKRECACEWMWESVCAERRGVSKHIYTSNPVTSNKKKEKHVLSHVNHINSKTKSKMTRTRTSYIYAQANCFITLATYQNVVFVNLFWMATEYWHTQLTHMNDEHICIRILFMIYSDQTSKANILIAYNKRRKHTHIHMANCTQFNHLTNIFKNVFYMYVVELKMTQTRIAAASDFFFIFI